MSDVGDLAADPGLAGGATGRREAKALRPDDQWRLFSLKFALYPVAGPSEPILSGRIERIGRGESRLVVSGIGGSGRESHAVEAPDQAAAAWLVIKHLERNSGLAAIAAIGNRVVHGGVDFTGPMRVTPRICSINSRESALSIRNTRPAKSTSSRNLAAPFPVCRRSPASTPAFTAQCPGLPRSWRSRASTGGSASVAMGSTGFLTPISWRSWSGSPIRRRPKDGSSSRTLGFGTSLAAVQEGRCLEPTMGFTPASGLVMGTRSGDLDPSLNAFLTKAEGITPPTGPHGQPGVGPPGSLPDKCRHARPRCPT